MLKIVSGIYGGRQIEAPKGSKTRPTTNRAREAVFSSLASVLGGFEGDAVLDLFAGSGALGLEALSRGAAFCTFVDNNRQAINCVKKNLDSLKVSPDSAEVVMTNSKTFKPSRIYDLVLLDPPYAFSPQDVFCLCHGAKFVYYEHSALKDDFICFDGYEVVYDKEFGEVHSTIMKKA